MKKKNKIIMLIIFIVALVIIFKMITNTHSLSYEIKYKNEKFTIQEKYLKDNYYIEIKSKENIYPFRLTSIKGKRVIKDIYFYKDDDYECILPIIKNNTNIDMMCYYDNTLYDYNYLSGNNSQLDDFVKSIKKYNSNIFEDNTNNSKKVDDTIFYNVESLQHSVYISSYKGLSNNAKSYNLFKSDVYENKVSIFVDNYYLIADYDNNFEFKYFYVINLKNQKTTKLKSKDVISLDSYIQGIVDNKVYLYDKDNENQYEINIKKNTIKKISNNTQINYYEKGKWNKINKQRANKELYFDYSSLNNYFTDYDYVLESDYYYYLFEKEKNVYKLFRVDKNNLDIRKYILDVDSLNISAYNDYIYFKSENKIYYYSDSTGLKTLLLNEELKFNDSIKYYVY